ncbi:class I SAM-dependent methyltransferase [Pseudarthrobacter sulfonivorans]|uniref:class I SAM-dependent methyltransferase n=1 Tax=Pseudarthrobacter sulfonivorans TaxID=121292 RepID=UPI00210726E8|nr:class I SAM-dependent methyltransferase [Pseudarthrobacter sulfonivorans]
MKNQLDTVIGTSRLDEAESLRAYIAFVLGMQPQSLLDIGFGHGELLKAADERGIRSYGIDVNDGPHPLLQGSGVKTFRANAENPGGPSNSFDFVTIRHTLHHLPSPRRCLEEARRLARALIIVSEVQWDMSKPENALASNIDHWHKKVDRHLGVFHENPLEIEEILNLGQSVGMAPVTRVRFTGVMKADNHTIASQLSSRLSGLDEHPDLQSEGLMLLEMSRHEETASRISETVVFRKDQTERRE